jgi:hypothetical protein
MSNSLLPNGDSGDPQPIKNGLIVTVGGGLVLALILWAVGRIGAAWGLVRDGLIAIWQWLTGSVPLPVWLVLVGLLYVTAVTLLLTKRRGAEVAATLGEQPPSRAVERRLIVRELDRFQKRVMRAMADADGATPTLGELADDVGTSLLRIEQTVEELEALGYLAMIRDVVNGPAVDVTRAGRDYLIAKGLA